MIWMDDTKISLGPLKEYADEFCGDLVGLFQNKYNFTVDDIYFSDKEDVRLSHFTRKFLQFCYNFARRRIEVENQSPKGEKG